MVRFWNNAGNKAGALGYGWRRNPSCCLALIWKGLRNKIAVEFYVMQTCN